MDDSHQTYIKEYTKEIKNLRKTMERMDAQICDKEKKIEIEINRNWHWMWSTFTFHKKYNGYVLALLISLPKLFSSIFKILIYVILNMSLIIYRIIS